jgi:lipoyl(octanoyl) transferase
VRRRTLEGVDIVRAGRVGYLDAWERQRELHAARVAGTIDDTVLLLEHDPVYTAGKRTEAWERPTQTGAGAGTPVVDVDRGGRITWHGPGQLTGYPIVKLRDPVDVVAYVRDLESALIEVCAAFGVATTRIEGRSGVWVPADPTTDRPDRPDGPDRPDRPDRKVAAIGIRVARGVAMHGFALNCDCDLAGFDAIVPCGISDAGVTTLSVEAGRAVTVAEVLPAVESALRRVLDHDTPSHSAEIGREVVEVLGSRSASSRQVAW